MAKSICTVCDKVFKSVAAFDAHRTGSFGETIYKDDKKKKTIGQGPSMRRCMTTQEMLAAGMVQNDKGWWVTSLYENAAHQKPDEIEEEELEVPDPDEEIAS